MLHDCACAFKKHCRLRTKIGNCFMLHCFLSQSCIFAHGSNAVETRYMEPVGDHKIVSYIGNSMREILVTCIVCCSARHFLRLCMLHRITPLYCSEAYQTNI
uniref:Uncharacterized protein n=1 Tax=Rhipicephalus zambeziensis TaxID=60191 RepID=A0A224Y7L6_9ACAR